MKKTFAIILAFLLLAGVGAQAVSLVRYEGGAEEFVFLPGTAFSESDLFDSYKMVMPGDVLTQRITVRNTSDNQVRIYLRAEKVDEQYEDFLSRINLQVSAADGQIFDAAVSETGQLTENTLLGTFRKGGATDLVLTLTVPYDLNNDYMCMMGIVPWTFLVEEVVEEPETPQTGDEFDLAAWLMAAGMILAAIGYVLFQMKRQKAARSN
nr:hypothetical protein [Clostridia bacterium]